MLLAGLLYLLACACCCCLCHGAPFYVLGLLFFVALGVLARLMPQLQVFFIAMPATISVGLILLAILLAMMMGWYLMHFEETMALLRGA